MFGATFAYTCKEEMLHNAEKSDIEKLRKECVFTSIF